MIILQKKIYIKIQQYNLYYFRLHAQLRVYFLTIFVCYILRKTTKETIHTWDFRKQSGVFYFSGARIKCPFSFFSYFLATKANRTSERHLYSVPAKKSKYSPVIKCLTCQEGYLCLYNNAIFSPNVEYYVLECLGPGVPKIEIRSIYNQTISKIPVQCYD